MFASLIALALVADAPKFVKPVSVHAVTATGAELDFEFDQPEIPTVVYWQEGGDVHIDVKLDGGPKTHWAVQVDPPFLETHWFVSAGKRIEEGHLSLAPARTSTEPFTFAVVGDSRDHLKWAEVARAILEKQPRFVLTTGDAIEGGNSVEAWRDYYLAGRGLFARVPVFSVMGNHDLGPNFATYNPAPKTGIGPSTYAFTYGNAGFIAIDSNAAQDPVQHAFVARALKALSGGPLFVFHHHPLYSCGVHGDSERMRQAFQALFEQAKVTFDFAGHDHDLILWKPVNGVRYAVSGGGGTVTYPLVGCSGVPFAKQSFGFILVTVAGAQVSAKFFDEHGIELFHAGPIAAAGASVPATELSKLTAP